MSDTPIYATLDFDGVPLTLPPSEYDGKLRTAYNEASAAVQAVGATDGWIYNSTQEEIEIFTKKPPGSNTECSKGIGYVDAPPLLVSTLFNSTEWRPQWDGMHDRGEKVETLDQFTGINYNSFKAPWPVSGRDFTALSRTVILPPSSVPSLEASGSNESTIGAVFTFSCNIETPKCPPKKGLVRGVLHYCGLWIEAVPGNPNRSKVIYTLSSDPNGSIPKSLVNAANVKQPLCIAAIRGVLKKNPKLRGEVEKKIAGERQKSIENRQNQTDRAASSNTLPASAAAPTPAAAPAVAPQETASDVKSDDSPIPFPPSRYDGVLMNAYNAAMAAVQAQGATDGWVFNSRQEEIDIYMKSTPGSTVQSCKGIGIIPYPVETVEMVFNNNMYRTKWDDICQESKELKTLDWSTGIAYSSFGAPWPVSARDFLAVGRSLDEPLGHEKSPGVKFSWSTSIEDDKLQPKKKGTIRGTLHFAGLWIEPLEGDSNKCKVIYTLSSDPNGSIPKSIVNAANVKQPLCISTVSKFIRSSPEIIEKMRIQQSKENEASARLKAEYKANMKKKVDGDSDSSSSSSSSSTPSFVSPSSSLLSTFTPTTLSCDVLCDLLRNSGPYSCLNHSFGTWKRPLGLSDDEVKMIEEAERSLGKQEEDEEKNGEKTISMGAIGFQFVKELTKVLCGFGQPSSSSSSSSPSSKDRHVIEEDENVRDPHGSIVRSSPSSKVSNTSVSTLPQVGLLCLSLLDLRQVITTLSSLHLSNLRTEREKDGKKGDQGMIDSMYQQCFIHFEMFENDGSSQGQVCHVSIDLAHPGGEGAFTVAPTSLMMKVHDPHAKLVISLYTQRLDILPSSSQADGNANTNGLSRDHTTAQSVGGKIRNFVNPLALGGVVASGLENGFDSFLHVFDGTSRGSNATSEALQASERQPHPVVLTSQRTLTLLELLAPTKYHGKIHWLDLKDEQGWSTSSSMLGGNPIMFEQVLQHSRQNGLKGGASGGGGGKKVGQQQQQIHDTLQHPIMHTVPRTTHALLLQSRLIASSHAIMQGFMASARLPSPSSSASSSSPSSYRILFQTLDGAFDLLRISSSHRSIAVVTYEKMQVGLSQAQLSSGGVKRSTTTPILVSKMLLSPDDHVLASTWYDLGRKRDLLSYARRLLRTELSVCLQSIDTDILQRRSTSSPPPATPKPASKTSMTIHQSMDPFKSFGSTQFVSSYTTLIERLHVMIQLLTYLLRILSWSDVYLSFFVLLGFIFVSFHPTFIGVIIPILLILIIVREAASSHFEKQLHHQQHHQQQQHQQQTSEEYERRKMMEKERFVSDKTPATSPHPRAHIDK